MKEKYKLIQDLHDKISKIETPAEYVEKKMGIKYPAAEYMRFIQMSYFPTASWTISEGPIYSSQKLVEWVVTGTLTWDYGFIDLPEIKRTGMVGASHKVQYKNDNILELTNSVKAANTDAYKKALNLHLNICDDIYTWKSPKITDKQKEQMLEKLNHSEYKARDAIVVALKNEDSPKKFLINSKNVNGWMSKL